MPLIIDATYLPSLLASLHQTAVLQNALAKSDIRGIQLLILNIANIDAEYLSIIQQGLQTSNIAEKFENASVKDIGLFLWNIYIYIDRNMAQQYCTHVDLHVRTQQLQEASPADLCFFLWNITSISSSNKELRVFHKPVILELLQVGWTSDIGWSMVLIGIATLLQASAVDEAFLQSVHLHENALAQWFATGNGGGNPYFLALALKGLQHYNEHTAHITVHNTLLLSGALQLLRSARPSAITAYSILLLEETTQWIEKLLVGEDKR